MKVIAGKFPVPTDLQPLLHCFWFASFEGAAGEMSPEQRCLPAGMIEMVINPTPFKCKVLYEGTWVDTPPIYLEGVKKNPVHWKIESGCALFGVSIKPEAMAIFFEQPLGMLAKRFADANEYLGAWLEHLMPQMEAADSVAAKVDIAIAFFRKKMAAAEQRQEHNYLLTALTQLRQENGSSSIDDLSSKSLISPRQLQRSFQENIGFSPKAYGRIIRFQKIFEYFDRHPGASLMDITYEFGFFDQSHFIREFKEFTGEKPKKFLSGFDTGLKMPLAVAV